MNRFIKTVFNAKGVSPMPKIIENAEELLLNEAKRQIDENGYDSLTVRSIARGCNIGLGTVYNYFGSKEDLVACLLLKNWRVRITRAYSLAQEIEDPMEIVELLYGEIRDFMLENGGLFSSDEAKKEFKSAVGLRHAMLREQIARPIFGACVRGGYENAEFLSKFTAEAVLHWTVEGAEYGEISAVLSKLFVK